MASASDDTTKEVNGSTDPPKIELVMCGVLPGDRSRIRPAKAQVIGRSGDCNVQLDFGEVSRRHAALGYEGSTLVLHDLGSTNGTYVDGRRIRRAALCEGAVIRIGTWLGQMEGLRAEEAGVWCTEAVPGLLGGVRVQRLLEQLRSVAPFDLPVVLVGATGSGKERFAAALHHYSRRTGPLHAINCAALPATLAESELFGHERGAFTGAETKTRGHFRAAEGGTLFLDEVQELSPSLQAKVLRAIELKQVTPLGDSRSIPYDARVVVASQCPLPELVAAGRFREDLAMRLGGITMFLPSLAQRRGDIPTLFDHFLREHSSALVPEIPAKVYERLCLYPWPGNVRELELLARRTAALHTNRTLSVSDLPDHFALPQSPPDSAELAFETRDDEDRHALKAALTQTGGNMKRAAAIAKLSRARAYRLLGKSSMTDDGALE